MNLKTIVTILLTLPVFMSFGQSSKIDNFINQESHKGSNVEIANKFIVAFYSFNPDSLRSILSDADESRAEILYYQKWAECGNYKIIRRNDLIISNDSVVLCPVTVKDDLIGALGIDFCVTDTFHLTITDHQIHSVETSSNDPAMFHEAKKWVKQNKPELIDEPCRGIWNDGTTPCECVKAMVKGFEEFKSSIQESNVPDSILLKEFNLRTTEWVSGYNSKDAKNLIPLYAEDAVYVSGHVRGLQLDGRNNVIEYFQNGINGGGHIDKIEILSMNLSCDMATLLCRYEATNSGITVIGRNLLVLKRIEGKWLIIVHMTVV